MVDPASSDPVEAPLVVELSEHRASHPGATVPLEHDQPSGPQVALPRSSSQNSPPPMSTTPQHDGCGPVSQSPDDDVELGVDVVDREELVPDEFS
jgi:hypothetical protein